MYRLKKMRHTFGKPLYLFALLFITVVLTQVCFGAETNESIDAAGRITVTDVTVDPSVLMTGDVGLVTFTVENTGSSNVAISNAELISKDITVLNGDIYKSSRTIGAGTKTQFSFTILANQPENIYYPAFYLNYKDAGSLRYNIPIRVEEPELAISVSGLPDSFSKGVKSRISLMLGNAKSVNMTGITVVPSGEGIQFNQTSFFIGNIGPHSEKSIPFEITPSVPTNLAFNVSYTCGMNAHQAFYSIPVTLGEDKLAADPIINNVEFSSGTTGSTLSGDVSNAGLSDAYGVIVSYAGGLDGAENPNQKYVIGTVESGDYASFEIVYPQNLKSVPVEIQFKDESGNQFSKKITLEPDQSSAGSGIGSNAAPGGSFNAAGGPPGNFPTGGASTASAGSGGSRGGVNPMNPLSGAGNGLNGLPITEMIYGVAGLLVLIILWIIWRRKFKGKKISFTPK